MAFRKIKAGLVNSDIDQFIGEIGNLFFDIDTGSLRLSDGTTPGGTVVGGGAGGAYTLPTASTTTKGGVKVDGTTITINNQIISATQQDLSSYATQTYVTTRGYITSYTETDPVFLAHAANNVTNLKITNWDTAYGWGNHASAGYLTSVGTISYNSLSDKPSLFSGSYTDLTNKPTLFSGSYTDLTNKPSLFSGSYTDLTNKPTLVTSYNDLTDKPTIYSSAYIGTTSLDFTRASASQTLSGVSISGNAATVTNGVYTTDTGTVTNTMLAGSISNNKLSNSSITVNGSSISLGGSATVKASTTNALTIGTGLSGTSFDGGSAVTIAIDSTVALRADTHYIGTTSIALNRTSASQTLTGVSIDGSVTWTNPSPAPSDPWKTLISAASGTATIVLYEGLPGLGSNVSWTFDKTKLTFPDASQQTTAYTGNAATVTNGVYTTDTGTVTNTMLAGSIANNKLSNSSITVNGSSISLGGSATITAAAGTLTGTTLASGVTASSLTSVGTLTSLTTSGKAAITYQPGSATGAAIEVTAKGTQGGTDYADFLKITNSATGATNPSKYFRLALDGTFEIINNAYTANLFSVSDAGVVNANTSYTIGGKKAVNGPAFRAYANDNQTITSGSQQKVTFTQENFDTDGCFASSRFTPTVAGYYQFNSTVRISGGSTTGEIMLVLYKNGSEYARGTNEGGTEQGSSFYSQQVSDVAYANGTGDYFEVYIQQTSGSDKTITSASTISYFSGVMVRGA